MKKKILVGFISGLFVISGAIEVSATSILEVAGNNTLVTAQNIDSAFSTGANGDIFGADSELPWGSISATGDGTYDSFFFFVIAGTTGYFDIDYGQSSGGSTDTKIGLWDSNGNKLAARDDGSNYQSSYASRKHLFF